MASERVSLQEPCSDEVGHQSFSRPCFLFTLTSVSEQTRGPNSWNEEEEEEEEGNKIYGCLTGDL
jgi:hypothetical protein